MILAALHPALPQFLAKGSAESFVFAEAPAVPEVIETPA
jgi:hypothetical protein